jgi:hypothetical protein
MRGPLMMVALDPSEDFHTTPLTLPAGLEKTSRGGSVFEYASGGRKLRFRAFYSVRDDTYNTYFTR